MFVNVLPVAVVAAVLGATGRPIDMATVFIMGISLGIAVDDTSFFIHGYSAGGADGDRDALAAALRHTGPSMIATCVVIVIGFSVLLLSSFTPMRTFGGMTAARPGAGDGVRCLGALVSARGLSGDFDMNLMIAKPVLLTLASCALIAAQAPDAGRDVARKAQLAQFTFKTMRAAGEMTLTRGTSTIGQRTFSVELIEREADADYDQARIVLTAPTALKETQLISWSSGAGEDQQWLITPRTQRVQRIADRGRQAASSAATSRTKTS